MDTDAPHFQPGRIIMNRISNKYLVALFLYSYSVLFFSASKSLAFETSQVSANLVGKWREINNGTSIIIEKDGSVLSSNSSTNGSAASSNEGGGNLAIENKLGRCVYDIVFLDAPLKGAASWALTSSTGANACIKTGVFIKVQPSSNKAADDASETSPLLAMAQIDIIYAVNNPKSERLANLLKLSAIKFRRKSPSGKYMNATANNIDCSSDLPIEIVKQFADYLLSAGVELKAIQIKDREIPPKSCEINGADNLQMRKSLTRQDVKIFDTKYIQGERMPILVKNDCLRHRSVEIAAMYIHSVDISNNNSTKASTLEFTIPRGKTAKLSEDNIPIKTILGMYEFKLQSVDDGKDAKDITISATEEGDIIEERPSGWIRTNSKSLGITCK